MKKTLIKKNILIRKRPADYEMLEVVVGFEEEVTYEDEDELKERVNDLNKYIRSELLKEVKRSYRKYWRKDYSED